MVTIKTRQSGDVTILSVTGKLDITGGAARLREAVRAALSQGHQRLVLDLAEATYVDSAGIGELVVAYTATSSQGGKLKLSRPSPKLSNLLHMMQLASIFEIFGDEVAAIASFG